MHAVHENSAKRKLEFFFLKRTEQESEREKELRERKRERRESTGPVSCVQGSR